MERTFVMIKPDGVQKRLVGECIKRFEQRGLKLVGLKMLKVSPELAAKHYAVHEGKDFYDGLMTFILSGPVVAMVLEGNHVIPLVRAMMGPLNPLNAASGTIRGDYTADTRTNIVHGSDSPEAAAFEIALWFQPSELL